MPLNDVSYTPRVETIDPDLDRRLEPIVDFWQEKIRQSPMVNVAVQMSRAFGLGGLIVATTLGVAGSSFAQSAPPTTGSTIAVTTPASTPQTGESAPSADSAAKDAAQNPLASTISVPFQNNTYYDAGPEEGAVNAMIVEPVIPFRLGANVNLITRTIVPIIRLPSFEAGGNSVGGLGNVQPQFYFSPSHPGKIIWGLGPQLWLPTATDDRLGINEIGGGVAGVIVTSRGHFMIGSLVNNMWTGRNDRDEKVNEFTLNPFVFYNFAKGWYVVSSPVITADWTAQPGEKWTVPVGGGAGRIFKAGAQPLNARVQFWKDVKTPTFGQSWTMQAQIQVLFIRKPQPQTHAKS
jgi:hypothetical protein